MQTSYKPVRSPFQVARKRQFNVQSPKHPVRLEIQKFIGAYQIAVQFEEDQETLQKFKHIPGLIAILCTLRKDGQIVGLGRSVSVVNRINRIIERTVSMAINGSFMSAANNATKILDSLRLEAPALTGPKDLGEAYRMPEEGAADDMATARQVDYLKQLIQINLDDPEREQRLAEVEGLTKEEASQAIASFTH